MSSKRVALVTRVEDRVPEVVFQARGPAVVNVSRESTVEYWKIITANLGVSVIDVGRSRSSIWF